MAGIKPTLGIQWSPLSIARILWKRKLLVLAIWILVGGVGAVIVRKLPAIYQAEAVILVDSQKIPEKYVTSTVSTDLQDRIQTISQEILSSTRLKKIIEDFDLYHDERRTHFEEEIIEMMRRDTVISLVHGWTGNRPGAFRVGYQGPNPAVVAQVTNRLANLFIEENLKTREVQAEGTSEFIATQLQDAKKQLDTLETAVSQYKLAHNGELPQQEAALIGALARLQAELEANRDAINRADQEKLVLENTLSSLESTVAILSRPERPATVTHDAAGNQASLPAEFTPRRPESALLQDQLDTLRLRYSDDYPDVRRLRDEVARQREVEKKEAAAAGPAPSAPPAPATAKNAKAPAAETARNAAEPAVRETTELRMARDRVNAIKPQIALTNRELEFRKVEQTRILKDIHDYQDRVGRLPVREQEMARLSRDYEIQKENYKSLLDKAISAGMATDMERRQKSERFTLLDPAQAPEKPFKPNRPVLYGLSGIVGLLIGLAFGVGRELKQDVLLGEWELPEGLQVLGRLPYIEINEGGAPKKRLRRLLGLAPRSAGLIFAVCAKWLSHYLTGQWG